MNLLLDTHIWIWSVLEPKSLSSRVLTELANPENQLWLSSISVWEVQFLYRKKRIELAGMDVESWIRRAFDLLPLSQATSDDRRGLGVLQSSNLHTAILRTVFW